MNKDSSFTHGNLAIVWDESAKPTLDQAHVLAAYTQIFAPALETDMRRMLAVWAASVRKRGAVSFERFWDGMTEARAGIGKLALPDLGALEKGLDDIHARYISRDLTGIERHCADLTAGLARNALPETHPGFIAAKQSCVAADTSHGVNAFGSFVVSFAGRAALYDAQMGDPENGLDTFIKDWIENRRSLDLKRLREEMYWAMVSPQLEARRLLVEERFKTRPADGDLEVEFRQHEMRTRNRPRNRAA